MGRPSLATLPIDPLLPGIAASLRARGAVVIEAPPGAGKTTRVPPALLAAGFGQRAEIVVLQPRRLPARLAAERVAGEMGERTGETVGYTVRFAEEPGRAHVSASSPRGSCCGACSASRHCPGWRW